MNEPRGIDGASGAPQTPAFRSPDERLVALHRTARDVRISILRTIDAARLGHIGGDLSSADILVTLFFSILRLDPRQPHHPDRDRLILSKGHCAAGLYSALAHRGFIPPDALTTFAAPLSALNGHPNRLKVPGVEANTGPLGHGLPIALGSAIAASLSGVDWRTFVVLGDGELQEGSNWEAIMAAGHRGLSRLTAVVDRNRLQQGDRTETTNSLDPLAAKWTAFGWEVREIDGHDIAQLYDALAREGDKRPVCVIANTVKGKGVSFMEDRVEWHHKVPSTEQVAAAIQELNALEFAA